MPLPDLIEVVPATRPIRAVVTVPGSKSITNRALILAALADGVVTLDGALWSEDTQVMANCLRQLGFELQVAQDPSEPCNRAITVRGRGGVVPQGGSTAKPTELFVENAGTAARFLAAFVCLGRGVYRLHGVPRMHERPQAGLFKALRQLGYHIDAPDDRLPALIHGGGCRPGNCTVSIAESSQFASAVLLAGTRGGWSVDIEGENDDESPYVLMTSRLIQSFPHRGGAFQIEPDASSGSYFWAAGDQVIETVRSPDARHSEGESHLSAPTVQVAHWPTSGWQIDERFESFFAALRLGSPHFQIDSSNLPEAALHQSREHLDKAIAPVAAGALATSAKSIINKYAGGTISRQSDLGDSIMTAIALAPLAIQPTRFTDLGRLRVQECERVTALRTELTRCGARVEEVGDTLTVHPSKLHGAEIETYNDHRVAMCFAILGLKLPGIRIKNPACVKKTFPNFFQKLAAKAPDGLGASLLDQQGRVLGTDDLFAE